MQDLEVEWWGRAEHLGMDILEDLLHWCTGWVDWNLILDTTGGPNHLGNRCDANIIADPKNKKGHGTLVMQASYYYMGHFSRFLPPGSKRVGIENSVVKQRELTAEDVVSGEPLVFLPCSVPYAHQTLNNQSSTARHAAALADATPADATRNARIRRVRSST